MQYSKPRRRQTTASETALHFFLASFSSFKKKKKEEKKGKPTIPANRVYLYSERNKRGHRSIGSRFTVGREQTFDSKQASKEVKAPPPLASRRLEHYSQYRNAVGREGKKKKKKRFWT
jgi:hypothetical protein